MRDASTRGDVSCYRACATLVTVTKVRMPHWASSRHYWSHGNSQTDLLCPRQFIKAECNGNKIIHVIKYNLFSIYPIIGTTLEDCHHDNIRCTDADTFYVL